MVESNDENFKECLQYLLQGYRDGYLLLRIKPLAIEAIVKIYYPQMNGYAKNIFNFYKDYKATDSKSLLKLVNQSVQLIPESTPESIQTDQHNFTTRTLHCKNFLDTESTFQTTLLAENQNDNKVYKTIAELYCNSLNCKDIKVRCRLTPGGGLPELGRLYRYKFENESGLCLAIIDSDITVPGGEEGISTEKTIKLIENCDSPRMQCTFFDSHRSIENLIPYSFYLRNFGSDPEFKETLSKITQLDILDDWFLYLNIKTGLKHFDLRNIDIWKSKCDSTLDTNYYETQPVCKGEKACSGQKKCKGVIVKGFKGKPLDKFSDFCTDQNIAIIHNDIKQSNQNLQDIWHNIGKLIFSWTCGQEKQIINS